MLTRVKHRILSRIVSYATFSFVLIGCGGTSQPESIRRAHPTFATATNRPICLVLSVGDSKGLAHIGAITAVEDACMEIRCVVGNSMGALIGSLYATAPDEDPRERYRSYIFAYTEETKKEIGSGLLVSLFGLILAPVTAGSSLVMTAGGALSVATTSELDRKRTVKVLDRFFNSVAIEDLGVAFATFHTELTANEMTASTKGNLAEAVGKSIANPIVFPGFDAKKSGYIDPGLDRVARTPIEDACKLFPTSRILAVNVTGHPAHYAKDLPCPVLEVRIDLPEIPREAMKGDNEAFDAVVASGESAVKKALARLSKQSYRQ